MDEGIFDPANELADCTVLSYSEINSIVRHVGNRWCWINETARVHLASRRCRDRVAARGARAAAGDEFLISLGRNDRANLAQAFRRGLSE